MTRPPAGRAAAYLGVAVGLTVSIWANIAHAMTRPTDTPAGQAWAPDRGSLFLAAFWPLALFLALEVLSRTAWTGRLWPWVARTGVAVVASVAAVVSYLHLHGLLLHYGESRVSALIGPLAIDGLMAVCAAALLTPTRDTAETRHHAPREPAETPTGTPGTPTTPRPTPASHTTPPQVTTVEPRRATDRTPVSAASVDKVTAALRDGQPMSTGQLAAATGLGRSTVARAVSHLLTEGRLMSTIGVDPARPKDPYYSLVTAPTGAAQ